MQTKQSVPMQIRGHISVDWSDEHVRPEVINQIDGSRGGYNDALHLVDITFGRDPENRPSDNNTLYLPDGYPESVVVRVTRHDAERLYRALGKVLHPAALEAFDK